MKIDKNKTYRTKDGKEVRIYAIEGTKNFAIHGAYKEYGSWQIDEWTEMGRYCDDSKDSVFDLIEYDPTANIPEYTIEELISRVGHNFKIKQ
jgi:hypothetical protein